MTIIYQHITEQEFNEFLNVLKQVDPIEYQNESIDNFYDLYRYWNDIASKPGGRRRFFQKIEQTNLNFNKKHNNMNEQIINRLTEQANYGKQLNNTNGTTLARISNLCTWMIPNDLNITILPTIGAGAKRRQLLEQETIFRSL